MCKTMMAAMIAAATGACAPDIPMQYSMECLGLVQATPTGQEMHDTTRPRWAADPEEGRGPIRFDFSHLAGEREIEYEYVSYLHRRRRRISTGTRIVDYGPRFQATCSLNGEQVVLDGVISAGEWEESL